MKRLPINKNWRMYVGGSFVRSESGGVYAVREAGPPGGGEGASAGNPCRATPADLNNAVEAASKAFPGWSSRSPFHRGQVLYQVAEIMEGRFNDMVVSISCSTGAARAVARKEAAASIDRIVYYAGWADKYVQVLGSANPVAGPYCSFTAADPIGVVATIAPDFAPLLAMVSQIAPAVVSGNTAVALVSECQPGPGVLIGEILAATDLPGGVVNLLTGQRTDLLEPFGAHSRIQGLDFFATDAESAELECAVGGAVKRCKWRRETCAKELYSATCENVHEIRDFIQFKTTWHSHLV